MQRNILILIVVLSVAFGAAAVAATDHATVGVEQEPNEPATVAVTDSSGDPVENASVTVEVTDDDQPDYEGVGNYTADANGTVELPAPDETVEVAVTATVDNETVSTEATLEAHPDLALTVEQQTGHPATVTVTADGEPLENATVDVEPVDENATYEGTGEHTTDENGTVELPAPDETVEVIASVEYQGASTSATATLEAPPELEVDVAQDRGHPATVTVTADDEAAANATVSLDVTDDNATYAGANGTYTTDENGTVELPAPDETVNVTVAADFDGASAETEATLKAPPELGVNVAQDGPGLPVAVTVTADESPTANVSVDVNLPEDENTSYAGVGSYETDENGTVELPAPEETVDVTVTATYQGAEESIVATLEGVDAIDEDLPFGQQLQQFKAALEEGDRTGEEIAAWVTENNPGDPPDHAGPKDTSKTAGSDDTSNDGGNGNSNADGSDSNSGNAGGNGNGNAGNNGNR